MVNCCDVQLQNPVDPLSDIYSLQGYESIQQGYGFALADGTKQGSYLQ